MTELVQQFGARRKQGVCSVCGQPYAVRVQVRIEAIGTDGKRLNGSAQTASKATAFCADHGFGLFDKLVAELLNRSES